MKYNKGFIGIGMIIAIIVALTIGGGVVYYATKTSTPSSNTEKNNYPPVDQNKNSTTPTNTQTQNRKVELSKLQTPSDLLIQVNKDLNLSSEVVNVNQTFNAYQLKYSKDKMSQVTSYFSGKLKKLWEKDGNSVFANGYMQCTVGEEAVACLSYFVESGSMRPTFSQEQVLKTKNADDIKRGDIIVFAHITSRGEKITLTKRVIGLPGETLKINNGTIYINNEAVKILALYPLVKPATSNQSEIKLSSEQYYVLGDFTEQSYDSRTTGPINSSDILAEVVQ